jgi:hypothetical protein
MRGSNIESDFIYATDFILRRNHNRGFRNVQKRIGGCIKNEIDINQKKIDINQNLEFIDQNDRNKNHNSLVLNPLYLIVSGLH